VPDMIEVRTDGTHGVIAPEQITMEQTKDRWGEPATRHDPQNDAFYPPGLTEAEKIEWDEDAQLHRENKHGYLPHLAHHNPGLAYDDPNRKTLSEIAQEQLDAEDLDIPHGMLIEKATIDNSRLIRLPQDLLPPPPPVYRWEIPLDDRPGYVLPIEITEAASIEHARNAALAITIGADEIEEGRNLTAMETAWVKSTEPTVVRDTSLITLGHEHALFVNAKLQAEQARIEKARRVLEEYGIDPDDPEAWITAQRDSVAKTAEIREKRAADDRQRLCAQVERTLGDLRAVALATGFATPDPVSPPKPDVSGLVIVAPEGEQEKHPDLADAQWIDHLPFGELTQQERDGLFILLNDNNGLAAEYIMLKGSTEQQAAMRAAVKLIKTWIPQ
jgi:hypothetical protein